VGLILDSSVVIAGAPLQWPIPYTIVHWAALLPGLPAGSYDLCCRTIDDNAIASPCRARG